MRLKLLYKAIAPFPTPFKAKSDRVQLSSTAQFPIKLGGIESQYVAIARHWLKGMEFLGEGLSCRQYLIAGYYDTDHEHIHISPLLKVL
ncbi:MAG TPA: hypothetical protein DCE56_12870, partial [Cyanobacteria bacterium UBA8553]|nr:hypothetical protein [Cyanobacteria bacterium UBA8553]